MRVYLLYSLILGISAIFTTVLGIYVWSAYRYVEGRRILAIIFFLSTEVLLVYALLPWVDNSDLAFAITRLRYFGFAFSAAMGLLFALQFSGQRRWLTRNRILLLLIIPSLTQIILWVQPLIPLFFATWSLESSNAVQIEVSTYGIWYAAYWTYDTICIGVSVYLLIHSLPGDKGQRRRSVIVLTLMYIIALILTQPGGTIPGYPELRLAPFGLVITSLVLMWLIATKRLLDLIPVAYDTIFHSLSDAVFVIDSSRRILQANGMALHLAAQVSPTVANPLRRKFADVLPQIQWQENVNADGGTQSPQTLIFQIGSQERYWSAQISPLKRSEIPLGSVVVLRDITTQFESSRKLIDLELEQERRRILYSFIRDASHEFRTPLTTIKTSVYLIKRNQDEKIRSRQVEIIDRSTDRILHLVEDLKTMVTLDTSSLTEKHRVDLTTIVSTLVERLQKAPANTAPSVQTSYAGDATIAGNIVEMTQAISEVLENAVRHTPPTGSISVGTRRVDGQVIVTIRDTGSGMDAETARQAFNRFYRLDNAHTTAGFGLGLAITQKIVERHGGTISLESELGSGTCVTMCLPFQAFEGVRSTVQQ